MWLFVFIAEAIYRDFRGEGVAQDHGRDASGSRVALAGDFLSSSMSRVVRMPVFRNA